mmetsp:Transcript_11075/g.12182  ORF Transcript_11075/g.12182 Transcript_11075/m.12182 type:complete len:106 (+) Transcript_11075:294-611(+)
MAQPFVVPNKCSTARKDYSEERLKMFNTLSIDGIKGVFDKQGYWEKMKETNSNLLPTYENMDHPKVKVGDEAPGGRVFDLNGKELDFKKLIARDKPVVLNFGSYT